MKRLFPILLTLLLLIIPLVSCGDRNKQTTDPATETKEQTETDDAISFESNETEAGSDLPQTGTPTTTTNSSIEIGEIVISGNDQPDPPATNSSTTTTTKAPTTTTKAPGTSTTKAPTSTTKTPTTTTTGSGMIPGLPSGGIDLPPIPLN